MTPHFLETSIQAHSAQQRAFYLYDYESINHQCRLVSSFHSDNFQARYAMKANPDQAILQIMQNHNIWIDACSEYEVYLARDA
jgi:diaminopimelate decarboxylase